MQKKNKKTPAQPNQSASTPSKRPTRWLLIGLLVIVAGFAAWKFWPKKTKTYLPDEFHYVEPTQTAKNPILELLPADETGIDFQNLIIETAENNITTNINIYIVNNLNKS